VSQTWCADEQMRARSDLLLYAAVGGICDEREGAKKTAPGLLRDNTFCSHRQRPSFVGAVPVRWWWAIHANFPNASRGRGAVPGLRAR
jgi:hypothetical protein